MRILLAGFVGVFMFANAALAEFATYGSVDLTGLVRNTDWPNNPPGVENTMVCNVNGPDGFVSIRSGPGTNHRVNRSLKRLAIIEVDSGQRRGNWVRVLTAYRTHTTNGRRQNYKSLHVSGWVHDGFLCSYLD